MKSTLKIDYASLDGGRPVIKIIQPSSALELKDYPDGDYDVRDKLISDFLHHPLSAAPNTLFEVVNRGPLEKAEYSVTIISPLDVDQQFYRFKHTILNKMVPWSTLVHINSGLNEKNDLANLKGYENYLKITQFFDWLDQAEWATWDEQNPWLVEISKTQTEAPSNI